MSQLNQNSIALEELKTKAASLPAAITIDSTLTKSGQAADAKAVGDALVGKAKQSQSATLTVEASAWTGDSAPYTATVPCSIAKANNNLVVGAGNILTDEELAAMSAAMIVCTAQTNGAITLEARGEIPTIDLPVNVLEVG